MSWYFSFFSYPKSAKEKRMLLIKAKSLQLISVIIPALNEQEGIKKTITSIPKNELYELGYDLETIVIDGNSTDQTRRIAQQMGARVFLEKRKGYGKAFRKGFDEAKGDILITLDADGTYPAELIPDCIQRLTESGLDFISVNRFSNMQSGAMSLYHKFGNGILSLTMRLLYSINVHDSQSGMWVMSKNFIKKIDLKSDNFSVSEEIKIIAFKFFKSLEVDGKYYRRSGTAKLLTFRDGWRNFLYLFTFKSLIHSSIKMKLDIPCGLDIGDSLKNQTPCNNRS